ncbi:MAG TPA: hypothetical protein VFB13_09245 [Reyranella sp.]|nr:hypothetical protein [Reyranella sp.]
MSASLFSLGGLVRGLMALGGSVVFLMAWPVARSALLFQKTDAFYDTVRAGRPFTLQQLQSALATVDAAIAAHPTASRHVQRSELLGAVAATKSLKVSDQQRRAWQQQAKADLELGLGDDPGRSLDWQRLAIMHEWLDGPSRDVPPLLFMSIETGRMMSPLWEPRLRIILDNWGYFSDQEKARLSDYIVEMWRRTDNRYFLFGRAVYDDIDEVILRYVLRHEPNAQEELSKVIAEAKKWRK